jgi:luciferase family oxidoreductase group 1
MPLQFGVLDFGSLHSGENRTARLSRLLNETVLADRAGCSRYWLGEHHSAGLAWANPVPLIPRLADRTAQIRIGPAGILIHLYSALQVAQDFSLLATLHPDRMDLGIARGAAVSAPAGQVQGHVAEYARKVAELAATITGVHEPVGAHANPAPGLQLWLLGSRSASMELACQTGSAFSYSLFHNDTGDRDVLRRYRDGFRHGVHSAPICNIAVAGFCAATEREARQWAAAHRNEFIRPRFTATPGACADQLRGLAVDFGSDEVMFLNLVEEPAARLAALSALGAEFTEP